MMQFFCNQLQYIMLSMYTTKSGVSHDLESGKIGVNLSRFQIEYGIGLQLIRSFETVAFNQLQNDVHNEIQSIHML